MLRLICLQQFRSTRTVSWRSHNSFKSPLLLTVIVHFGHGLQLVWEIRTTRPTSQYCSHSHPIKLVSLKGFQVHSGIHFITYTLQFQWTRRNAESQNNASVNRYQPCLFSRETQLSCWWTITSFQTAQVRWSLGSLWCPEHTSNRPRSYLR